MSDCENKNLLTEQIAVAEELIPEMTPEEQNEVSCRPAAGIALPLLLIFFIALFIGFALTRYPQVAAAFAKESPLHQGSYAGDPKTDQCIVNLWHISRLLQEGKPIPAGLVCPASGRPYIQQGDRVVCPNPQAHKLSMLGVSKAHPVPEVK